MREVYISAKGNRREHRIFVFGSDPFSLGDKDLWFKWFAFALLRPDSRGS